MLGCVQQSGSSDSDISVVVGVARMHVVCEVKIDTIERIVSGHHVLCPCRLAIIHDVKHKVVHRIIAGGIKVNIKRDLLRAMTADAAYALLPNKPSSSAFHNAKTIV